MEQANPEAEVINVVSAIADNERAKAIDAIQDMLYAKASDAMSTYKQTVAQTFFDEPVDTETNETDNGND
jgi:PHP family Zn ribbon phosphoesterase